MTTKAAFEIGSAVIVHSGEFFEQPATVVAVDSRGASCGGFVAVGDKLDLGRLKPCLKYRVRLAASDEVVEVDESDLLVAGS